MTAPRPAHPRPAKTALAAGADQLVDAYLAEVATRLPGPAQARASIVAELRAGLLDAADAHRDAGLSAGLAVLTLLACLATRATLTR